MNLTIGSLFSGAGGFELGFEATGFRTAWQCEIDQDATDVLERHWPNVRRYRDVREIDPADLEPVDVVVFGSPCQDMSVAGKRGGLAGERSGLFHEATRIISGLRPRMVVFENVPGMLSSNDGADMHAVLDAFDDLRYVIDCDILDAQHFGVPQRRRRVFVVCQSVESLLAQKTTSSALTIAQCLIEILGHILAAARGQSPGTYAPLGLESGSPARSLQRRTRLFGLESADGWWMSLESLGVLGELFPDERNDWGSPRGLSGTATSLPAAGILSEAPTNEVGELGFSLSIAPSWRSIWEDLFQVVSAFTTSTRSSTTTESRIYTCAQALLHIASLIAQSTASSPTYWSAASSALTVIEEFTSYARQAGNSLFTDLEWVQPWRDFLGQADAVYDAFERAGERGSSTLLPVSASLCGHSQARGEAGQAVARDAENGAGSGGGFVFNARNGLCSDDVTPTLQSAAGHHGWTPNGGPLYVAPWDEAQITSKTNRSNVEYGAPSPTRSGSGMASVAFHLTQDPINDDVTPALGMGSTHGNATVGVMQPAVGFAQNQRGEIVETDYSHQLTTGGGKPGEGYAAVREGMSVRRLTPRECEALMGWPRDHTRYRADGREIPDGPRYRLCGNGVVSNVAAWLARRAAAALREAIV